MPRWGGTTFHSLTVIQPLDATLRPGGRHHMSPAIPLNRRVWIRSIVLAAVLVATGGGLVAWKSASIRVAAAASASHPEPMEVVTTATAALRDHGITTTAIGTVRALQSITLRNEL